MHRSLLTSLASAAALAVASLAPLQAAHANPFAYVATPLVTDTATGAAHVDAHLVNAWGIAFNPVGYAWVANNHTGTSTLYDGDGVPQSLVVTVPAADGVSTGSPTGIVYSGSNTDFLVTKGALTGAARFVFASEDGLVSGWAPTVDSLNSLPAAQGDGAIYKGLALAGTGTGMQLYATDFHHGTVDVYDHAFHRVTSPGGFQDPLVPKRFAPFGIQNVGGNLLVTFARQDKDAEDEVDGRGLGFVDLFDADGHLLHRIGRREGLNAPWAVALAPANFGHFSNCLLVGNFGDGTITAYSVDSGAELGQLHDASGNRLHIPGLWALQFGNGILDQPTNTLFYAAGPDGEEHGAYGRIDVSTP